MKSIKTETDYGLHIIQVPTNRVLVRTLFGLFGSILALMVNSIKTISMEVENNTSLTVGYTDMATIKLEGLWVNLNDDTYHVLGTEKENENVLTLDES